MRKLENRMLINLKDLSSEARGILVKAKTLQGKDQEYTKEYEQLYMDFMKYTNHRFIGDGSFNDFQVAVTRMKRITALEYKAELDYETKGMSSEDVKTRLS